MDTPDQQTISPAAPETTPVKTGRGNPRFNIFALLGILVTIAAWIILSFNGDVALWVSVAGFILGCLGLKASTRTWRNTATTAIVASAVLMVVLAAFLIVFRIGLNAL